MGLSCEAVNGFTTNDYSTTQTCFKREIKIEQEIPGGAFQSPCKPQPTMFKTVSLPKLNFYSDICKDNQLKLQICLKKFDAPFKHLLWSQGPSSFFSTLLLIAVDCC